MAGAIRRLLGLSVRDLAQEVDDRLADLATARGYLAAAEEGLALAKADVADAVEALAEARDALFESHPDLAPKGWNAQAIAEDNVAQPDPTNPALLPGQDPSKFEVVEVDDADDPRFTAGVSPVPVADDEPLPPLEWGVSDG